MLAILVVLSLITNVNILPNDNAAAAVEEKPDPRDGPEPGSEAYDEAVDERQEQRESGCHQPRHLRGLGLLKSREG